MGKFTDWCITPSVGKLMEKAIDGLYYYVQNQLKWQSGMKKELERLQENYPKITAVVSAARRAQTNDQNSAFNKWIWKLRDAIDEADDLFDGFEYMKHQQQDNWQKLIQIGERAVNMDPMLKRLEEVVQKLDNISAEVSTFLHLLENINQEQREQQVELHKTRETGSSPRDDLIGRGEDKESVIEWLRKPSDVTTNALHSNISLLSIVGHGGMGKTTLLQHVYADEMTKEFDLRMWVCVSDKFDVKKVITDMLECLQNKRPSLETLDALQETLGSKVKSKKFLLVLDDIWDDNEEKEAKLRDKWSNVLSPLAKGGLGSKILITTRTESAASMIAKVIIKHKEVIKLEGLKEDECLQLLNTHAFDVGENPNDHKKLKSIAVELVKKLYGCPLAAKVMGGVLNSSLDERHWRNVLNSSLGLDDIFPILKLSYIFLPEHLQICFSFCSIFKQDHLFDKDDLVRMWIAVGFIQPSHIQGETLEDIGEGYFDVLVKKSFFEKVTTDVLVKKSFYEKVTTDRYKMHDLLHELAQFVSAQECFRFVGDEMSLFLEIPETIRHLSVETGNPEVLKNAGRFKNLRTLHITNEYNLNLVDILIKIFQVIRSIRLLHLNYSFGLKMIPEEIEYLQHLRYLRFSNYNVKLLPRSLSSLYNLQFIIVDDLGKYSFPEDYFPRDMNNLFNLRYLTHNWVLKFPGIGKLKLLQELNKFKIKNENGYRIEELEHMNDLRYLNLCDLNDLRDAEQTYNAKLCDKRKLTHLHLDWGIGKGYFAERVFDNLQPHNYLKTLEISNYRRGRSARWMNEAHLINNLEVIKLSNCNKLEILPPFGQLPFLKTLTLDTMRKLKRLENKFHGNDMHCVFPSLQTLSFQYMYELVDWFDASVVDGLFPCLTQLRLEKCPNLKELPYLPLKLESLEIEDIGWKTLNSCSISKSIPLRLLKVRMCPNLTFISPCVFPSLQRLTIGDVEALVDWFDASVVDSFFPCLTYLRLENCPNLKELPYLPPKLESLKIEEVGWKTLNCCSISKSIPLVKLRLRYCKYITSISVEGEIGKLKKLTIRYLLSLESIPCSLTNIIPSLEYLEVDGLQEYPDLPLSFRRTKSEREVEHVSFRVEGDRTLLRFEELEHMNEIHNLYISDLKYVGDAQEAYNAKLCDKRKLMHLSLNWDIYGFDKFQKICFIEYVDGDLAERVLDNLQPHNYLQTLQITGYLGARSSIWMKEAHLINNLEEIKLYDCFCWEILPPFGQLPFLKSLTLSKMPNVKRIENKFHEDDMCGVFPSLQKLYLRDMGLLVDWFDASVVDGLFPCLTQLELSDCPNLQELPYLPPKLESLKIEKIGWKTLNCCNISKSIPLQTLHVRNCPNITSISLEGEIEKLEKLTIENLPSLESFPSSLTNISSLKFLKLAELPQLQECPDLPPSLEELFFK